jgi:hypothetical protein
MTQEEILALIEPSPDEDTTHQRWEMCIARFRAGERTEALRADVAQCLGEMQSYCMKLERARDALSERCGHMSFVEQSSLWPIAEQLAKCSTCAVLARNMYLGTWGKAAS